MKIQNKVSLILASIYLTACSSIDSKYKTFENYQNDDHNNYATLIISSTPKEAISYTAYQYSDKHKISESNHALTNQYLGLTDYNYRSIIEKDIGSLEQSLNNKKYLTKNIAYLSSPLLDDIYQQIFKEKYKSSKLLYLTTSYPNQENKIIKIPANQLYMLTAVNNRSNDKESAAKCSTLIYPEKGKSYQVAYVQGRAGVVIIFSGPFFTFCKVNIYPVKKN